MSSRHFLKSTLLGSDIAVYPGLGNRLPGLFNGFPQQLRQPQRQDRIQATHGSFDNNIKVLTETIARVSGRDGPGGPGLVAPLEWMDY